MKTGTLTFDMNGAMVDSMPFHAKSWGEFTRHNIAELAGSHVVVQVRDYEEPMTTDFLESLDA